MAAMALVGNVPESLDHQVKQGTPYAFTVAYGSSDPAGSAAELQVRDRPLGLVFASLSIGSGIVIDEENRRYTVTLSADQIAQFAAVCVYDLVLTPSGGAPVCVLEGRIFVDAAVSR